MAPMLTSFRTNILTPMQTVVLLHSSGTSHRMWRLQIEALARKYRVVAPDLPGHGATPGPFTFDRTVASVREVLADVPGPVHLCGISLFVTVALLIYFAEPARIASLILSGGITHPTPMLAMQRAIATLLPERTLASILKGMLAATVDKSVSTESQAELVAEGIADFRRVGKRTYLDTLRELAHVDLRPRLTTVAAPTLVLCGQRDKVNVPAAREIAAGIPGAALQIVPDAGHLWNMEYPELFTQTLAEFVAQVASRSN